MVMTTDTTPAAVDTAGVFDVRALSDEQAHAFGLAVACMSRDFKAAKARIAGLEARVAGQHALIGKLRRDLAVASRGATALRVVERIDRETAGTAAADDGVAAHVCGLDCCSDGDEPKPVRFDAASAGARGWGRWLRWSR